LEPNNLFKIIDILRMVAGTVRSNHGLGRFELLDEGKKVTKVFDWSPLTSTFFKPLIFSGFFVDT
jgi:hypothetical protein